MAAPKSTQERGPHHMARWLGLVMIAPLLAVVGSQNPVVAAGGDTASTAIPWIQETSPVMPPGQMSGGLDSVSCTSASACEAVGSYENSSHVFFALAASWNGTAWNVSAVPRPRGANWSNLLGISCVGPKWCEAVGSFTTTTGSFALAARWNGSVWSLQRPPNTAGSAVNGLTGVSCVSVGVCEAVGEDGASPHALALGLSGSAWTLQTTPVPLGSQGSNGLMSVSCYATGSCEAVGDYHSSLYVVSVLAEAWNGTVWTQQSTPNLPNSGNTGLASVSCTPKGICDAVGSASNAPVAERWNGTSWGLQTIPGPGTNVSLLQFGQVSCPSATSCVSTGWYIGLTGQEFALADLWNGATWTAQTIPSPSQVALTGLSCPSRGACQTVGSWGPTSGSDLLVMSGR
jgi:hypothetical protein